jgi:cell division protein FtsI (penicillin-binding protein 3)
MGASQNKKTYVVFLALTLLALGILSIRMCYLVFSSPLQKRYKDPVVSPQVVRGTILDRNGSILAIETPLSNLYFHLTLLDNVEEAAETVAPIIGMAPSDIMKQVSKYTTYALVKTGLSQIQVQELQKAIKEKGLSGGISIEEKKGRTYPATFHASQTIGFVDSDGNGLEGIEHSLDDKLSPIPAVGTNGITYGEDVTLALDIDIQYLLDVQIQQIADRDNPDYAVGIVMDAESGDILALSSYPWYNPSLVKDSTPESRLNHAVNYQYEPGSVFKIFSLAAEMEAGEADFSKPFLCDGTFTFDGITIGCHEKHGEVTPETMIAKSCNGAVASWALQTDSAKFRNTLADFGFQEAIDIDLPSLSKGKLKEISEWSARSKATISFGQELSTTALHLVTAATAIAGDGRIVVPHLVLRESEGNALGTQGNVLLERKITKGKQVISAETAKTIREYMHTATGNEGTAKLTNVKGVNVSAKTGTAQIYNNETKSYQDGTVLASTIALVPTEKPKYIIYIAAGNPKGGTIWGANIAAPAVGKIISGLVSQGKVISGESTVRL